MTSYQQLGLFDAPPKEDKAGVPKYCVIDLETGGVDKERNSICSVAVVRVDKDFAEIDRFYSLVVDTPDKTTENEALRVNGLTREQISKEGRPWHQVFSEIQRLLKGCVPVAHNCSFDYGFLRLRGYEVLEAIDTMELAWKVWPSQKAKLGMVYNRMYGHELEGAHNSLFDVLATIELLKWFYKKDPALLSPSKVNWDRFKR